MEAANYSRESSLRDDLRAGVVLTLPLYQGRRVSAPLAREQAQFHKLQAETDKLRMDLQQALLEVWLEIDQLQRTVRGAAQKQTAYRDLALENLFTKVARFGIQNYFDESLMLFSQYLSWKMPFYVSWHRKDTSRLLEFKQSHLDQIAELNSIDIEVYQAAEKKFNEIISDLDIAKLKRFQALNPKMSALLKLQARINKRLTGKEW